MPIGRYRVWPSSAGSAAGEDLEASIEQHRMNFSLLGLLTVRWRARPGRAPANRRRAIRARRGSRGRSRDLGRRRPSRTRRAKPLAGTLGEARQIRGGPVCGVRSAARRVAGRGWSTRRPALLVRRAADRGGNRTLRRRFADGLQKLRGAVIGEDHRFGDRHAFDANGILLQQFAGAGEQRVERSGRVPGRSRDLARDAPG